LVERLLIIINELHCQWRERHGQECEQLRAQLEDLQETRRDLVAQRDLWLERCDKLEQEKRRLLRRLLSLGQNSSLPHGKSQRPVDKKLFLKWGRRFAALSGTLERTLVQERQALQCEAAKLEEGFAQLQIQSESNGMRDADLANREIAHEHSRALAESANAQIRQELQTLNDQRGTYERQVAELQEEVERLAGLLLKEEAAVTLPVARAA
jgi:chromosome segregation ATPase